MRIQRKLHGALDRLCLLEDLHRIVSTAQGPADVAAGLEELKATAEARYKDIARRLHPDLNPDLEGATERMAQLNDDIEEVRQIKFHAPQPRPQYQVVVVQYGGFGFSPFSTGTSTTGGW
jgi:hypothetical protein